MSRSIEELETEIMGLGLEGRARLAEKLLLSLEAPSEEENLHLWVTEAERRLKELREGRHREPGVELYSDWHTAQCHCA